MQHDTPCLEDTGHAPEYSAQGLRMGTGQGLSGARERQSLPLEEYAELELFRRAIEQGNEQVQKAFEQHWHGLLMHWLHRHPAAPLAQEYRPPESSVTAAWSTFWQTTTQLNSPAPIFTTLSGMLAYLRCCLNSALLDAARQACLHQQHFYAASGTEDVASHQPWASGGDLWQSIKRALPERRERMLVELRYMRSKRPQEIVASHPQTFPLVEEVYRLERKILKHLRLRGVLSRS